MICFHHLGILNFRNNKKEEMSSRLHTDNIWFSQVNMMIISWFPFLAKQMNTRLSDKKKEITLTVLNLRLLAIVNRLLINYKMC